MLGVVKTRTIHGHCAKKNGTSFSGPAASIAFSISSWLRGVDLNHRPLGYEPNVIGRLPIEINDFASTAA
jgi:hypothetical protein